MGRRWLRLEDRRRRFTVVVMEKMQLVQCERSGCSGELVAGRWLAAVTPEGDSLQGEEELVLAHYKLFFFSSGFSFCENTEGDDLKIQGSKILLVFFFPHLSSSLLFLSLLLWLLLLASILILSSVFFFVIFYLWLSVFIYSFSPLFNKKQTPIEIQTSFTRVTWPREATALVHK